MQTLLEDLRVNRNWKARAVLFLMRFAQAARRLRDRMPWTAPLVWPVSTAYIVLVHYLGCIEIGDRTAIGPGLVLSHPFGIVIHADAVIGTHVRIRQNVTIGNKGPMAMRDGVPVIEDDVDIGAGATILGPVRVGRGAVIGAGSVVLADVPPGSVVAGVPAEVKRTVARAA